MANTNHLGAVQLPALKNISHWQLSLRKPSSFLPDPGSLANDSDVALNESLSGFSDSYPESNEAPQSDDSWTHRSHENNHALN